MPIEILRSEPTLLVRDCPACTAAVDLTVMPSEAGPPSCPACGATLPCPDERTPHTPAALVPFGEEADRFGRTYPEGWSRRVARLTWWIEAHGIQMPEDFRDVLAWCDSAAEVRFAWTVVADGVWHVDGVRSFRAGPYRLVVQEPVGPYRIDVVMHGPPYTTRGRPWALEIDGPQHAGPAASAHDARRTEVLTEAGYRVVRLPATLAPRIAVALRDAVRRDFLHGPAAANGPYPIRPTSPIAHLEGGALAPWLRVLLARVAGSDRRSA